MRPHWIPCLAFAIGLPLSSAAQPPHPWDGTWTLGFDGSRTSDLEGTVVVQGQGGSWRVATQSSKNPCVGREAPILVKSATADELVFEVNRSSVLAGCRNWTMTFKKVDDKTLQGNFTDGRVVQLRRP
ncbi:MAG: hypothetical protein IV094_21040 [Vitreoscilla sp.]|nr:hypothetical protein [Vitreoscilla sp.]